MYRRKFIKGSAILGMGITQQILVPDSGLLSLKNERKVYKILSASGVDVGTLPVMRAFAGNQLDYVSPYVLFDEFGPIQLPAGSDPLRVDAHPHAGVTPTTYFLEGTGHHKDSLNYDFQIGKGDFMMFSSGKGAIHMEESGKRLYNEGGTYHGFQIWLNTPAKHKFDDPSTAVFRENHMSIIDNDQYWLKVVLGQFQDAHSKIQLQHPAFYYHVKTKDNSKMEFSVDPRDNVFIYMISGKAELQDGNTLDTHQLALYQRGGDFVQVFSPCESEFLILGGQPLNEPVYSYGPFVMNTEDQIKACIKNYRNGLMGNPDLVN